MRFDVLAFLQERGGAPVTEVARAFHLPGEMAANLMVQLQDAGLLAEHELTGCHHATGGGCSGCDDQACAGGDAFTRGCCGLNAPYMLTPAGQALLLRLAPSLPEEAPHGAPPA